MGFPSMDLINTTYCTQMTKTSTTSLATRGPSSWDTGQANHYCLEGLQGKAEEGLALHDGLQHLGGEGQDHQGQVGLGGAVASQKMSDDQFKCNWKIIELIIFNSVLLLGEFGIKSI